MSLILEALKKSEQQRRLGEAPTLGSPALTTRRRRNLLPLFGALIVIAIGVGWWLSRTPATPATHAPIAQSRTPPVDPSANAAAKPAAASHAPTATTAPPAHDASRAPVVAAPVVRHDAAANERTTPARTPAPAILDRPGSIIGLPPTPPMVSGPNVAPTAGTATPPAPAATTSKPAITPPKPTTAAAAPTAATPAAAAAPITPTAPATAPTAAVASAPAPAKSKPAPPALPSVWELPYSVRKDLPDLALTMHVYSDDPKARFVVIRGARHAEGDDLGDGITLRAIREDGIELEYKGQRFVYPRDGR